MEKQLEGMNLKEFNDQIQEVIIMGQITIEIIKIRLDSKIDITKILAIKDTKNSKNIMIIE